MKVIKAPEELEIQSFSIFLAGSIEMGKAIDWQTQLTKSLGNKDITILNPRRDDWDLSWEQKIENPQFREQVEWELNALERANLIVMYFDPKTMSPISLMELGLFARRGFNMIVCCPEGFWRKGNVDIVCKKYRISTCSTLDELIERTLERVRTLD